MLGGTAGLSTVQSNVSMLQFVLRCTCTSKSHLLLLPMEYATQEVDDETSDEADDEADGDAVPLLCKKQNRFASS